MSVKNNDNLLAALLDTELTPEKDVPMRRFGVDFRIKALSDVEMRQARDQATFGKTIDEDKLSSIVIAKACLSPDWSDKALIAKFGPTPVDVVEKRLLPGEKAKLKDEIAILSGYGDDTDVDAIKN